MGDAGNSQLQIKPPSVREALIRRGGEVLNEFSEVIRQAQGEGAAARFQEAIGNNAVEHFREMVSGGAIVNNSQIAQSIEGLGEALVAARRGDPKAIWLMEFIAAENTKGRLGALATQAGVEFYNATVVEGIDTKGTHQERAEAYWREHPRKFTSDIDPFAATFTPSSSVRRAGTEPAERLKLSSANDKVRETPPTVVKPDLMNAFRDVPIPDEILALAKSQRPPAAIANPDPLNAVRDVPLPETIRELAKRKPTTPPVGGEVFVRRAKGVSEPAVAVAFPSEQAAREYLRQIRAAGEAAMPLGVALRPSQSIGVAMGLPQSAFTVEFDNPDVARRIAGIDTQGVEPRSGVQRLAGLATSEPRNAALGARERAQELRRLKFPEEFDASGKPIFQPVERDPILKPLASVQPLDSRAEIKQPTKGLSRRKLDGRYYLTGTGQDRWSGSSLGMGEFAPLPQETPQDRAHAAAMMRQGDSRTPSISANLSPPSSTEPTPERLNPTPRVEAPAKSLAAVMPGDANPVLKATAVKPRSNPATAVRSTVGAGMNGAALGLDVYHLTKASLKGDAEEVRASAGSAIVNGATLVDSALANAGKSNGSVSKALGGPSLGLATTLATTGIQVAQIQAEGGVDRKRHSTETIVTNAVGFGAGLGTGTLIGTGVATGTSGLVVGTLATGGTILVAAGAAAAASYAVYKTDQAFYGGEDARFAANLDNKQHMIGLAKNKFRAQLADPATGAIDFENVETLNRLSVLAEGEINKQKGVMEANSSYVPRWMRSGDGVLKQEMARSDMKIAESAKAEVDQRIKEIQVRDRVRQQAEESINRLLTSTDQVIAQERDEILARALKGNTDPQQKRNDIARLATMLGDDQNLGRGFLEQVEKQSALQRARQQVAADPVIAQSKSMVAQGPSHSSGALPVAVIGRSLKESLDRS